MLARKDMPEEFLAFNARWGAPNGRERLWHRAAARVAPGRLKPLILGPFGFQAGNSGTRRYEYPWAFHAARVRPGLRAVEIGGSVAGLQFVLARSGMEVMNVDPSEEAAMGWPLDEATFATLNRAFGTDVQLRRCFLEKARVATASVDRVFCISTLEHVPPDDVSSILREVHRILRPGGLLVLTVDLFLDLEPFTDRRENVSGRNVDVADLVRESGLELVAGERAELYGFPEFEPRAILANLSEYLYGTHAPVLAQTLVLARPGP
jgi:2-polyprenyl-3-methyl-5-hydroxy-6-metoxy-1,4-benzoquinol methylase